MTKKIIVSIALLLTILLFSVSVFANTMVTNTVNNVGEGVKDGIRGVVGGVENTVVNVMSNAGDKMTTNRDNNNNNTKVGINNDGYTASRTATTNQTNNSGMSANLWTWMILGITGIIIVALVWYYASQNQNTKYDNE